MPRNTRIIRGRFLGNDDTPAGYFAEHLVHAAAPKGRGRQNRDFENARTSRRSLRPGEFAIVSSQLIDHGGKRRK